MTLQDKLIAALREEVAIENNFLENISANEDLKYRWPRTFEKWKEMRAKRLQIEKEMEADG